MRSMTGYGRGHFSTGSRPFRIEVRSVNHRFLDVHIRLPWVDGAVESRVMAAVKARVARGRLDLSVIESSGPQAATCIELNEELARSLGPLLTRIAELAGCSVETAATLVAPAPGLVLSDLPLPGSDELWSCLQPALTEALDDLLRMRQDEGQALLRGLREQMARVVQLVKQMRGLAGTETERQRLRLEQRLASLLGERAEVDAARLAQEVALLAERCDISEELLRLGSHLDLLSAVLQESGEMGRKAEFLLQELHRELNTIGSKTQSGEIAHFVVEAKGAVEKMRELSQNVE